MPEFNFAHYLSQENLAILARVAVLILVGVPVVYMLSRLVRRQVTRRLSRHQGLLFGKVVLYLGLAFVLFSALNEFGFKLTHLLAAAGVVGIALGFASQTSISNIISGLFLITEQPFVVGDLITVNNITGEVLSIDILSIKLRTFDNRFVRIPNETLIKTEVVNKTHFPLRRLDVNVAVAYKENVGRVRDVLLDVAKKNPLCLQEPEPVIIFNGFGASSVDLLFGAWAEKADFLKLKNSIQQEIKERFAQEGIEIPFPHVSVYKGAITEPIPIKLVDGNVGLQQNLPAA